MSARGSRNGSRLAWPVFSGWILLCVAFSAHGQEISTYVGRIATDSFQLAWGTTQGKGNTIGRDSILRETVTVKVAGRRISPDRNWVIVQGLLPDTEYTYELTLGDRKIAEGTVRTYPEKAQKLAFFVIGDYGTGKAAEYKIAEAMWREFQQRRQSDNPVRFILTTGDNIYSDRKLWFIPTKSGAKDEDWGRKFFEPFRSLLLHVPFYPTLGNHDADGSHSEGDLGAYLDNFFFPAGEPSRYYTFSFGGLADFFALDSTNATDLREGSRQFRWLQDSLTPSKALWKIAYFHHPPFNAGPGHGASLELLRPVVRLFAQSGVQVVFNGHEHNFQYTEKNKDTGNVVYVITGAGGELRKGDVSRHMEKSHIAGWAPENHFLLVEIDGRVMKIVPLASEPVVVKDKHGHSLPMPVVIELEGELGLGVRGRDPFLFPPSIRLDEASS